MRDLRAIGGIPCVVVLWLACAAGARAADAQSLDVRLSEGEVIEMAAGEVAKAAALYREVLGDAEAQGAVRARALYLLARCERKAGNLKSAEDLLGEVIAKHAGCAPFDERAARLLEEIRDAGRSGAGEWLQGLRENESIQAQLFQMAMALVSPESEEGKNAAAKLLAMGPLAQPVLRTVMQTTRDPLHRRQLALILAQMGDFDALGTALDPLGDAEALAKTSALDTLLRIIPSFDADETREFREALDALPADPAAEEVRALCALAASDAASFAASLTRFDRSWSGALALFGIVRWLLENRLAREPQAAPALTAQIGDKESKLGMYCFQALRNAAPAALTAEVLGTMPSEFDKDAASILLDRKDYAALAAFLERLWAHDRATSGSQRFGGVREFIAGRLDRKHLSSAEPSVGRLIRTILLDRQPLNWRFRLVRFFFAQGPALPEFEKIVRHAAENDLELPMYNLVQGDPPPPVGDEFLALTRSLAVDSDPKVRTKVLYECLGVLIPYDPAAVQVLARHLHDPSVMLPENKAAAAKLLLVAVEGNPALAEEVAAVLVKDHASTRESYEQWAVGPDAGLALAAPLLVRLDGEADAALCAWAVSGGGKIRTRPIGGIPSSYPRQVPYLEHPRRATAQDAAAREEKLAALCAQAIEKHGADPKRALLSDVLCACPDSVVVSPPVSAFLDAVVADGSLPFEKRLAALKRRVDATPADVLGEFLARADGDVIGALYGRSGSHAWIERRPQEEKRVLIGHLARGPHKKLAVELATKWFQGEERAEIVGVLAADRELDIRTRACKVLADIKAPPVMALFIARLKDDDPEIRYMAVSYLGNAGGEGVMEALAGMLDDPASSVRVCALAMLRKLREQEGERELWKKWLEDRQKKPAEGGNAPPAQP